MRPLVHHCGCPPRAFWRKYHQPGGWHDAKRWYTIPSKRKLWPTFARILITFFLDDLTFSVFFPKEKMNQNWWVQSLFRIMFHNFLGCSKKPCFQHQNGELTELQAWLSPQMFQGVLPEKHRSVESCLSMRFFMGINLEHSHLVSKNIGVSPQIIHFNRVFHEINHPFWGVFTPTFWFNIHLASQILKQMPRDCLFLRKASNVSNLGSAWRF